MAICYLSTKKILLLSVAIILITSQAQLYAHAVEIGLGHQQQQQQQQQQQNQPGKEQEQSQEPLGSHDIPSSADTGINNLPSNNISSAKIVTDFGDSNKPALIKIPIINGVATPVDGSILNQEVKSEVEKGDSAGAEEGKVLFELDHHVPSVDVLQTLYPNEGRTFFSDRADFGNSSDGDNALVKGPTKSAKLENKDAKHDFNLEALTLSKDKNGEGPEGEPRMPDDAISHQGMKTLESMWALTGPNLEAKTKIKDAIEDDPVEDSKKTTTPIEQVNHDEAQGSLLDSKKGEDQDTGHNELMQEILTALLEEYQAHSDAELDTHLQKQQQLEDQEHDGQEPQKNEPSTQPQDEIKSADEKQKNSFATEIGTGPTKKKVIEMSDGKIVVVNKLNKNYEDFDKVDDDVMDVHGVLQSAPGAAGIRTGSRGDRTRNRVLGHHHHRHVSSNSNRDQSLLQQQQQQQQHQQQQQQEQQKEQQVFMQENSAITDPSLKDVVTVDENPYILSATGQDKDGGPILKLSRSAIPQDASDPSNDQILAESGNEEEDEDEDEGESGAGEENDEEDNVDDVTVPDDSEDDENMDLDSNSQDDAQGQTTGSSVSAVPDSPPVPEPLASRGLVPSVLGAHHCTPQFCVNISLSDDGKFATFHIERPLAATGWISLGVGYAMTMADLLIFWPNPTSENGGGPRGAVLSRRTSHAYVEPHLVGHLGGGPLGDNAVEASLYPPNEYILHNSNPGASTEAVKIFPDDSKFIVQFTRPVRTKNLAYKLTPGQEQDFCWAYSPKPVSPDQVADPGAHITQHLSVGSFGLDVAENQPQLKQVLVAQKVENEKLDAAETKRKQKELEKSHKKLREGKGKGKKGDKHVIHKHASKNAKASSAVVWLVGPGGGGGSMALQGFSSLVVVALMFYIS